MAGKTRLIIKTYVFTLILGHVKIYVYLYAMQYRFPKSASDDFRLIKLRHLADLSDIEYMKIYNALVGKYSSLTESERTKIFNSMYSEVEKAAAALGFTMDGKRIRVKDPSQ